MAYSEQTVTSIHRWSDKTFSLKTTRPDGFNFENGEFVTIGLRPEGKMIARAYSIVSTNDSDHLEFLSIHVPDGPLTSRLAYINEGDNVWVNNKPTGTLTLRHIQPGRNLYLISTGTGLAPFICLIRDPKLYESFDNVILVHTVRTVAELAYKDDIEAIDNNQLHYVPTVTREAFDTPERGADLFRTGKLFQKLGLPDAQPDLDRVMICGNPNMNKDMINHLEENGWTQTSHRGVGNFTTEKAFVIRQSDEND